MKAIRFNISFSSGCSAGSILKDGTFYNTGDSGLSNLEIIRNFMETIQRDYEIRVNDLFDVFVGKKTRIAIYKEHNLSYLDFVLLDCAECKF